MTRKRILLFAVLAGIGWFIWWRTHADSSKNPRPASMAVETTLARVGPAPVELSAMGQVLSLHSVGMHPQVSGTLAAIYFTEGADVAAGDKLFLIDPAPYKAAVAQSRGQLARDRAALSSARSQYQRLEPLAQKEYVSAQELETARDAMAQAQAVVESDVAALEQSQINLDRTLVTAPIAGRTGSLAVKTGNVVAPSDATPVVVINQLQPVQLDFSIPQSLLGAVQDALARGPVLVRVGGEQPEQTFGEGRLIFVDNAVNASTGTVRLKAEVDNRGLHLWPGAFVTVIVTLKVEQNAVLLPELAVQPGAAGSFVFLIDDTGKVSLRTVTVARQIGRDVVISDGLKGGEKVVAKAPRNLTPGMTVNASGETKPDASGDATAPKGEHQHRGKPPS